MELTPRTRIEFRFSTCPSDFGYEGKKSNWRDGKPHAVGTPNTIADHVEAALRRAGCGSNSGTMYACEYRIHGVTISNWAFRDILAEYHAMRECEAMR